MTDKRVVRVAPDVVGIDRDFDYRLPDALVSPSGGPAVGTIVRVPLHGRNVRGWIVAEPDTAEVADGELRDVLAVLSPGPPPDVVDLCHWTAHHWCGSRVAVLRSASPPNLVRHAITGRPRTWRLTIAEAATDADRWADTAAATMADRSLGVVRVPPLLDRRRLTSRLVAAAGSTIVVVADRGRAQAISHALQRQGADVALVHSEVADAERTQAWARAAQGECVVVGGRVAVLAPVPDLAAIVVVDDLDEAMQEERMPTWHARDVAIERARRAGARCTLVSPVPSVAGLAALGGVAEGSGEPPGALAPPAAMERDGWPRTEILDRRADARVLSERVAEVLQEGRNQRTVTVAIVNRKGRLRLQVCRECGELVRRDAEGGLAGAGEPVSDGVVPVSATKVCPHCGALGLRALRAGVTRLAEELTALLPGAIVSEVDASTAGLLHADVYIGTESLLHRSELRRMRVGAVIFLDFDQELMAPRARSAEQALWLLARAAQLLAPHPRASTRLVVQTFQPEHPVLTAVAAGSPAAAIAADVDQRRVRPRPFPPFGAVAQITGDDDAVLAAADALRALDVAALGVEVLGVRAGPGPDALVWAPDPGRLADALGPAAAAARAHGRLRVVVDPPRL